VLKLNLLWRERGFLSRGAVLGLLLGTALAFLLPKRFESTVQLMPPDSQSNSGLAMLAGLASRTGNGLGAFAGDLLGMKSSGALFIGVLHSRTAEEHLVDRFQLKSVYRVRMLEDACRILSENTSISEDRKSGIITIMVTDHDPRRAAALAQAYVEELDREVAQLSTSSARREREFLEGRLNSVQTDLEAAEKDFSQFASKNSAIDIKEQGKAMFDAAATVEGQLIAAKSELEGLKQIYTDNNVRVRSSQARITELQSQLDKIGGKGESTTSPDNGDSNGSSYPSIRKLPLLGVTYADLRISQSRGSSRNAQREGSRPAKLSGEKIVPPAPGNYVPLHVSGARRSCHADPGQSPLGGNRCAGSRESPCARNSANCECAYAVGTAQRLALASHDAPALGTGSAKRFCE
jgi:hypothetical protein